MTVLEARESAGLNHAAVYPAVLIQEGMDADAAGVLVTTNPFDREDGAGVYINAKRGLGIGIGLAICQSLIIAHGGSIAASNHPDGGAFFQFSLPVAAET